MESMKKTLLSIAAAAAACSLAAEPLKVLMIGNSFSHSVLVQLPKIAHDNGDELLIENLMIPGCTLAQHAENIAKAEKDPAFKPYNCDRKVDGKQLPRRKVNIQEALAEEKWDVVTIQQGSSKCFDATAYHPCGEEVVATIRKLAPQAKVMFQMTWSYNELDRRVRDRLTGGRGWFNITRDEMFELIKDSAYPFAASNRLEVIPVGLAVEIFRNRASVSSAEDDIVGAYTEDKGWTDTIHLNGRGHYLQGLVWYKALFGKDPRSLPDDGNAERRLMREVAFDAFSTKPEDVSPAPVHALPLRWRTVFYDDFDSFMTFAECWKPAPKAPVISKDGAAVFSGNARMERNGVTPEIFGVEADFTVSKGRAGFACETVTYTLAADGTLTAEWLPVDAEKKEKITGQAPVEPGATLRLGIIRDNGGTCLWHFMTNGVEFARCDTAEAKPVGSLGGEDAYAPLFAISQGDATMDDFSLKIPVDAAESPNLVINSSFEHDADGFPPYYTRPNNFDLTKWREVPYEDFLALMGTDTNEFHSGKNSFRISCAPWASGGSAMVKNVATRKGACGVFSAWIKADRPGMKARLSYGTGKTFNVTTNWVRYEVVCTNLPAERNYFSPANISLEGRPKEGTVWFDDLQAEILDERPSAADLASGRTFATPYRVSALDAPRFSGRGEEKRTPGVTVPLLADGVKPSIDLDSWTNAAAVMRNFYYRDKPASAKTETFLACDAENLYVGIRAYGGKFTPRDGEPKHDAFWVCNPANFSVEVFLDPDAEGNFWQFAFNDWGYVDIGAKRNVAWSGEWTHESRDNPAAGAVDYFAAFPLSHFASSEIKDEWPLNIGRNCGGEPNSLLKSIYGGYHNKKLWPIVKMPKSVIAKYRLERKAETAAKEPQVLGRLDFYMNEPKAQFRVTHPDGRLEEVSMDIRKMPVGTNEVEVAGVKTKVVKLPYRKGATQVNRFARCLVHDGRSILPVAAFAGDFGFTRAFWPQKTANEANFYHHYGFRYQHALMPTKRDGIGINPNSDAFIRAAETNGDPVIVWTGFHRGYQAKTPEQRAAWAETNTLNAVFFQTNYQNLTSFIVMDEPELGTKSDDARAHLREIHPLFPYNPVQMNNTHMGIPNNYAGLETDVLMLDAYLTSSENGSVAGVVEQVDVMRKAGAKEGKPCFYFLVGGNFPLHYKEPSYGEQIAQSWGSLCSGCTGISYFYGFFMTPGNWRAVTQVAREAREVEKYLVSETLVDDVRASEPRGNLRVLTRQLGKETLVATCNIANTPLGEVTFTMPESLPQKGKVEVLFENRTLPLRDGVFTDHFEPYTRHIYRIRR